jgi:hypothetical protein
VPAGLACFEVVLCVGDAAVMAWRIWIDVGGNCCSCDYVEFGVVTEDV